MRSRSEAMSALLTELKTRARLELNAARRADADSALKLRDCLNHAARDVGFSNWEHGRRVLGAEAVEGEDMGTFWHAPSCNALLNAWFARHEEAREALAAARGGYLLPYRRQFVVVQDPFIREIGLDPADPSWTQVQRDLVQSYGSPAWFDLALRRLKSARSSFSPR
jgi:hypothetical protein